MGKYDGSERAIRSLVLSSVLILTCEIRLLLVISLSIPVFEVRSTGAVCPAPFDLEAGKCVFVNTAQSYSWCSANQHCKSIGGELINAYSSLRLLPNMSSCSCGCYLWLGVSDIANERDLNRSGWQMINDYGIMPMDNTLWHSGNPDSLGNSQDCIATCYTGVGKLCDLQCSTLRGLACEYVPAASSSKTLTSATWMQTPFKRTNYNPSTEYCYTDVRQVDSKMECLAAAMRTGNSRHVLYNNKLRACRLLQFTDAQVEQEIETSADWVKFSL